MEFAVTMRAFAEYLPKSPADILDVLAVDEVKDIICKGTTVAGNPCKASKFEGTEYCVAHQDQG